MAVCGGLGDVASGFPAISGKGGNRGGSEREEMKYRPITGVVFQIMASLIFISATLLLVLVARLGNFLILSLGLLALFVALALYWIGDAMRQK